jgi:hypothetical protein
MTAIYNQPLFGAMQADPYSPIQDDPTKPLMIRALENTVVSLWAHNSYPDLPSYYLVSRNGVDWEQYNLEVGGYAVNAGDVLYIARDPGTMQYWDGYQPTKCEKIQSTGRFEAYHNVMSMVAKDWQTRDLTDVNWSLANLFNNTKIERAPLIPAVDTMPSYAYYAMFAQCKSLVNAPFLPSRTVSENGYARMFYLSPNIRNIRIAATDISANECLWEWLQQAGKRGYIYCEQNVEFPVGVSGIPAGWIRKSL